MMTNHKFNWTRVEDLTLMNMKKAGMTHKDVAIAINRTAKAVECRWRELRRGMGKRNNGGKYITSSYDEADKALMIDMYHNGYKQWEIANVLGKSESAIGNQLAILRKQGRIC